MALLSDPALDVRQYLENLACIAVGATQQAEEMWLEVRALVRKARRRMAVVASFGVLSLMVGIAGFIANRGDNVRLPEVSDEASRQQNMRQDIASLQQQRKAEEAALVRQNADQQAVKETLQRQIADLQQQANVLQGQVTRRAHDLEAARTEAPPLAIPPAGEASAADQQPAREALQHQNTDLQQQANSSQDRVAPRSHDFEQTRTGTRKLPGNIDLPREQRTAEQVTLAQRKAHEQHIATLPRRLLSVSPPDPASSVTQPAPVLISWPRASQQLSIAREWLVTGRLDQARRALTIVQTQMVLQPVSDQPATRDVNALATDVGNAIRWLDMGANGQAMQALNQAIHNAGAN